MLLVMRQDKRFIHYVVKERSNMGMLAELRALVEGQF